MNNERGVCADRSEITTGMHEVLIICPRRWGLTTTNEWHDLTLKFFLSAIIYIEVLSTMVKNLIDCFTKLCPLQHGTRDQAVANRELLCGLVALQTLNHCRMLLWCCSRQTSDNIKKFLKATIVAYMNENQHMAGKAVTSIAY